MHTQAKSEPRIKKDQRQYPYSQKKKKQQQGNKMNLLPTQRSGRKKEPN
jgi:hypothetical protein